MRCNILEETKNEKWWKMPLWPINVQSLFFCFMSFFFFNLIRTQAFSVFSEVSCCVVTPPWDRTVHKCQKQQLYEQKRRPVDDLCVHSLLELLFFNRFLGSFQPSPLWSHCHRFFIPLPSDVVNRLSSSRTGRILDLKRCIEVFQCFLSALQQLFYLHRG